MKTKINMNQKSSSSSDSNSNNSKFGNKFSLNKFLKSKKGQYSLFSLLTLSVLLISGLFTFSLLQNTDTALAALNCPAGSTVSGNTCISNTPSSYTCPAGQSLGGNGAQCFVTSQTGTSYSCPDLGSGSVPRGGVLNGTTCQGVVSQSLVVIDPAAPCPAFSSTSTTYQQPSQVFVNGFRLCFVPPNNSGPVYEAASCPVPGLTVGYDQGSSCGYTAGCGGGGCYYFVAIGVSSTFSYAATATPTFGPTYTQDATPAFNTPVTPTSYTPEQGQITGLTCTPSSVVASGTVNCSGQATGAPAGVPYAGNITVTIDNGGGSITTAINPDGTFTASSVPVGTTTGTKAATTNLGGTTPISVFAPTTITATNIGNSSNCTSALTVAIGNTYSCNYPLTGDAGNNYALPTGGITAATSTATGQSPACTISGNGTAAAALVCAGIPTTGGSAGLRDTLLTVGTGGTPVDKGDVTLALTPLTTANIPGLTVTCGVGGTPGTVLVNSTTTCTFTLPADKSLPSDFKLGIGNATPAGTCAVGANNLVTCTSVPTGSQTGTQPINGQIGSNPVTPTGETVNVVAPTTITATNIGNSSNCTSALTVAIGNTYTCNYPLTGDAGNNYALPTGGITAATSTATGQSPACTISGNGTAAVALVCAGIPTTGGSAGLRDTLLTVGTGGTPVDKGDVTLFFPPLVTTDIPGLTVVCNGGNSVLVNSTTTCTFTLPADKSLPNNFKLGIGDAAPSGTCTVGANNLVTCTSVPTGSQTGTQGINGQIGSEAVTPTGETVNVTALNATVLPRTGGLDPMSIFGILGSLVLGFIGFKTYRARTKKLI